MHRLNAFKAYHIYALNSGECDPAYPALKYIAKELNLDEEQRYWLAWLYSACYSGATAYYIFLNFPDYSQVNLKDIEAFWNDKRDSLIFQTDRVYVKSNDAFIRMVYSWKKICGSSQSDFFEGLDDYDAIYRILYRNLFFYKRYSLFLLLEAIHRLTGLQISPTGIPFKEAVSSRNGLFNALGWDEKVDKPLYDDDLKILNHYADNLVDQLNIEFPSIKTDYWNLETTLCAFRKLFKATRYFGYYIDRQMEEIKVMQKRFKDVNWDIFWKFRREYFSKNMLGELSGWDGIRKERLRLFLDKGVICEYPLSEVACAYSSLF